MVDKRYNYSKKELLKEKEDLNKKIELLYAELNDSNTNMTKYGIFHFSRENHYQRYLYYIKFFYNQYKNKQIDKETFDKSMIYLHMMFLIEKKKVVDNKLLNLKLEEKK